MKPLSRDQRWLQDVETNPVHTGFVRLDFIREGHHLRSHSNSFNKTQGNVNYIHNKDKQKCP